MELNKIDDTPCPSCGFKHLMATGLDRITCYTCGVTFYQCPECGELVNESERETHTEAHLS